MNSSPCPTEKLKDGEPIPTTTTSLPVTLVDPISSSVYHKNQIMQKYVQGFSMHAKRNVFNEIRAICDRITPDTLFPKHGFVAGEFATFYFLSDLDK